jgi:hypothetical protein
MAIYRHIVTIVTGRRNIFSYSLPQKILMDCTSFSLLWISQQYFFTEQGR